MGPVPKLGLNRRKEREGLVRQVWQAALGRDQPALPFFPCPTLLWRDQEGC